MTNDYVGDCFLVAGNLVTGVRPTGYEVIDQFDFELLLIHAIVLGSGGAVTDRYYWHAWVEAEVQMPFPHANDPSMIRYHPVRWAIDRSHGGNILTAADYYRQRGRPRQLFEYTTDEARQLMLKTGNYGPWERDYDRYCDV